ncbi:enoyl-CoA hydratase-related protein [Nocardia sp. NPDC049190]|uniref:enoyl-CoA hydratase-related protein n=1 Tax=Nocardia sp. NPDC049190 TaxID=3155650 RepID=UPI0033DF78FA
MVMDAANRLVRAVVDAPVPVIVRIRGAAAGIGVGIALAADLVYASEDSYLLLAFINIGLMPDGGASALVAAAAGRPLAAAMALLGERLPATAARAAGLITAVVPDEELDATVQTAAPKIAAGPRRALELTKKALNQATLTSLDTALATEKAGSPNCCGPRISSRAPQPCSPSARPSSRTDQPAVTDRPIADYVHRL